MTPRFRRPSRRSAAPAESAPAAPPPASSTASPKTSEEARPARPPRRRRLDRAGGGGEGIRRPARLAPPRWLIAVEVFRAKLRLMILAGALGTILTYGACWLMPEVYQATATIVLNPALRPAATEEGVASSDSYDMLSAPTLERLLNQPANAARMKEIAALAQKLQGRAPEKPQTLAERTLALLPQEDRETLARYADDYAEAPLEGVAKSLRARTAIERKLAFDVVYSPLIFLEARAPSAALARALADSWAASFVLAFEELNRGQLRESVRAVRGEFERAQAAWDKTLADIERAKVESSLPLTEARFEASAETYRAFSSRAASADALAEAGRRRLRELQAQAAYLSDARGEWVGSPRALDDEPATPTLSAAADASPENLSLYGSLRTDALRIRGRLVEAREALRNFDRESPLEALRPRLQAAEDRLAQTLGRSRELAIQVPALQETLRRLEADLARTSPALTLKAGGPESVREELNPEWSLLAQAAARTREELARLGSEAALRQRAAEEARQEAEALRSELALLEARRGELAADRERLEARSEESRERFQELSADLIDAAAETTSYTLELRELRRAREELAREAQIDLQVIERATGRVAALEILAETRAEQVKTLQARLQELEPRLSQDVREVRLSSLATLPEEKIFPPRTVFALLGGMIAAGLVFLAAFLKRGAFLSAQEAPGS
jgi:hypothetical protein